MKNKISELRGADLLAHFSALAKKYNGNDFAADIILSALRGECYHLEDENNVCEVCGTDLK